MRIKFLVALAAGGLLVSVPISAHHAFNSEFDAAKPIKLTGVVKKMEWINPHSWITIDVKAADGTVQTWEIEAGAPNADTSASANVATGATPRRTRIIRRSRLRRFAFRRDCRPR